MSDYLQNLIDEKDNRPTMHEWNEQYNNNLTARNTRLMGTMESIGNTIRTENDNDLQIATDKAVTKAVSDTYNSFVKDGKATDTEKENRDNAFRSMLGDIDAKREAETRAYNERYAFNSFNPPEESDSTGKAPASINPPMTSATPITAPSGKVGPVFIPQVKPKKKDASDLYMEMLNAATEAANKVEQSYIDEGIISAEDANYYKISLRLDNMD